MATKNKKNVTKTFFNTVETVKTTASKANTYALKSTENVFMNAFNVLGQWQGVANKAVKGGLKLADTQQDIMFNTLEAAKGHVVKGFKRSKALLSK